MVVDAYHRRHHQQQPYRSIRRVSKSPDKRSTFFSSTSSSSSTTTASNNRRSKHPDSQPKQLPVPEYRNELHLCQHIQAREQRELNDAPNMSNTFGAPSLQIINRLNAMDSSNRRTFLGQQRLNKQQSSPFLLPMRMESDHQIDLYSSSRSIGASPSEAKGKPLPSQTEEWQTQFYKTKLCPYHVEGRCINGEHCRFAHNCVEVRPLPDLHRTKLCESYVKKEQCTDSSCPFAHDPSELRTSSHSFYKVTLCNFYKKGRCWNGAHCRFAHGIAELQASATPIPSSISSTPSNGKPHQQSLQPKINHLNKQQNTKAGQPCSNICKNDDNINIRQRQESNDFIFSNQRSGESGGSNDVFQSTISESGPEQPNLNNNNNTLQFLAMQQAQIIPHDLQPNWSQPSEVASSNSVPTALTQQQHKLQNTDYSHNDLHRYYHGFLTSVTERALQPITIEQTRRRSIGTMAADSNSAGFNKNNQNAAIINTIKENHNQSSCNDRTNRATPSLSEATNRIIPFNLNRNQLLNVDCHQTQQHQNQHQSNLSPKFQLSTTNTSSMMFGRQGSKNRDFVVQPFETFHTHFTDPTNSSAVNTSSNLYRIREPSSVPYPHEIPDITTKPHFEFTPLNDNNSIGNDNNQVLNQMEDVQSLTTALFKLIQSQSSVSVTSPTSTASWSTPERASPLSVPNRQTDSLTSPEDFSNREIANPNKTFSADQWAYELLKTLENVPTHLLTNGDFNSNDHEALETSTHSVDDRLQLPSLSIVRSSRAIDFPSFHQQFVTFTTAVAASPTKRPPEAKDDTFTNLFNLPNIDRTQQQNGNGQFKLVPWPPSLENLNSKPESLTVLPSLSNLSSFLSRTSKQKECGVLPRHGIVEFSKTDGVKDLCSVETPPGQQSAYTLSFDKLVGFVNDIPNDEDRFSSTVSTGATTTAVHSPRRPAECHELTDVAPQIDMACENSSSKKNGKVDNQVPSLATKQLLQAFCNIAPSATIPNLGNYAATFPSSFAPFNNNSSKDAPGLNSSSQLSDLFENFSKIEDRTMMHRQEFHRLSFPSLRTTDQVNQNEFSIEVVNAFKIDAPTATRHVSVPSPFPSLPTSAVEDSTPENVLNVAPDQHWTPVPLAVTRRSSAPRLPTKLVNHETHQSEILQTAINHETIC